MSQAIWNMVIASLRQRADQLTTLADAARCAYREQDNIAACEWLATCYGEVADILIDKANSAERDQEMRRLKETT